MKKGAKKTTALRSWLGQFLKKDSLSDQKQFSNLGKLGGKLVIMRATGTLL